MSQHGQTGSKKTPDLCQKTSDILRLGSRIPTYKVVRILGFIGSGLAGSQYRIGVPTENEYKSELYTELLAH